MVPSGYGMRSKAQTCKTRLMNRSGALQGSWTLFADPVDNIAMVDMPDTALHGHLLCTSREGTIAVISLKEMDQ